MELTHKQRLFVAFYLGESKGNATDAARRAGYTWPDKQGLQQLAKTRVRAAVGAAVASAALSANQILALMSDQATASLGDFLDVDENGYRVNLHKGKRRARLHTLKKVKVKTTRTIIRDVETETVETEIEAKDSFQALVRLGEYHGLWNRTPAADVDLEAVRNKLKRQRADRAAGRDSGDPGGVPG